MKRHFNIALLSVLILSSCQGEQVNRTTDLPADEERENYQASDSKVYHNARKIFYSMPSPLELISLIQSAGGDYRKDLLHNPNKVNNYQSRTKQALVLGVYGADLSYATIYEKKHDAVQFLAATKRLGESIGVHEPFNASLIERANANLDNRDSMFSIVTEMYWHTTSQLREENRDPVTLLIMAGGWAEGLYLGTSVMKIDQPDPEIGKRIAEQKFVSMQLQQMFEDYSDHEMVQQAYPLFAPTFDYYATLTITEEPTTTSTDPATGEVTIKGRKEINFSTEDLSQLANLAAELRNNIVRL
ncbi:MAG: hypothetical protein Kow0075_03000 [Salibacteraceae bacterium]